MREQYYLNQITRSGLNRLDRIIVLSSCLFLISLTMLVFAKIFGYNTPFLSGITIIGIFMCVVFFVYIFKLNMLHIRRIALFEVLITSCFWLLATYGIIIYGVLSTPPLLTLVSITKWHIQKSPKNLTLLYLLFCQLMVLGILQQKHIIHQDPRYFWTSKSGNISDVIIVIVFSAFILHSSSKNIHSVEEKNFISEKSSEDMSLRQLRHDLSQPITSAKLSIEALNGAHWNIAQIKLLSDSIYTIDNILSETKLEKELIDTNLVLGSLIESIRVPTGITLKVTITMETISVISKRHFVRMIENLLINSIENSPANSEVSLKIAEEHNRCAIKLTNIYKNHINSSKSDIDNGGIYIAKRCAQFLGYDLVIRKVGRMVITKVFSGV